jgi:hypothetical protein
MDNSNTENQGVIDVQMSQLEKMVDKYKKEVEGVLII